MCVVGCSLPTAPGRAPGSEDPGKGRFTRGQAGSSQERRSEWFGRRDEFLQQHKEGKSEAAPVPGYGTHTRWGGGSQPPLQPLSTLLGDHRARGAGFPCCGRGEPSAEPSRHSGSAEGCSTPGEKLSERPMETLEESKIVWETYPDQPYNSSRDILSVTTVAFQSPSTFSINKYFKSLCFKTYYI